MAQQLNLTIERRADAGTTHARALRRDGKIPGILYGHGSNPQAIAFARRNLDEILHRGARTSLITLTMDGKRVDTALLREVQIDPVSRRIIHVDLQRVRADETVHARLPVVTVGTPEGVRSFGGVMDVVLHDLEVEGPANKLPDRLEVNVADLGIHQHVTAAEIPLPEGFKMITEPDAIVVSVEPSKTERLLEEAEAVGAVVEQAEPEIIGKPPEEPPPEGAPE
ncbi:MAG TPA: 50S ribosomal protein L25 [Candidatus Rubrimentiphilum sp.]|nr:50S ribosomal protein L25 [Candidatus Rubrimentiphilum sp.]